MYEGLLVLFSLYYFYKDSRDNFHGGFTIRHTYRKTNRSAADTLAAEEHLHKSLLVFISLGSISSAVMANIQEDAPCQAQYRIHYFNLQV